MFLKEAWSDNFLKKKIDSWKQPFRFYVKISGKGRKKINKYL